MGDHESCDRCKAREVLAHFQDKIARLKRDVGFDAPSSITLAYDEWLDITSAISLLRALGIPEVDVVRWSVGRS